MKIIICKVMLVTVITWFIKMIFHKFVESCVELIKFVLNTRDELDIKFGFSSVKVSSQANFSRSRVTAFDFSVRFFVNMMRCRCESWRQRVVYKYTSRLNQMIPSLHKTIRRKHKLTLKKQTFKDVQIRKVCIFRIKWNWYDSMPFIQNVWRISKCFEVFETL